MTDQLVRELVEEIMKDPEFNEPGREWDLASVIAIVHEAGNQQVSGFRYYGEGRCEPMAPSTIGFFDALRALHTAMAKSVGERWKSCLIQLEHTTGRFAIDFEYEDEERWFRREGGVEGVRRRKQSLKPTFSDR